MTKLHLGCGAVAPAGWINIDGSSGARISRYPVLRWLLFKTGLMSSKQYQTEWPENIRYHNLCKPLPFADGSIDAVCSCHFLEHLSKTDAEALFLECYRVLKPGGVCRVCVPDLAVLVDSYLRHRCEAGEDDDRRNEATESFLLGFYDEVHHPRASHKWLYDGPLLLNLFKKSGFQDVKVMDFRVSQIGDISDIESRAGSLQVEGIK